jgi:hypothetical protein
VEPEIRGTNELTKLYSVLSNVKPAVARGCCSDQRSKREGSKEATTWVHGGVRGCPNQASYSAAHDCHRIQGLLLLSVCCLLTRIRYRSPLQEDCSSTKCTTSEYSSHRIH